MINNDILSIEFLGMELSPITLVLLATIIFVVGLLGLKMLSIKILSKGRFKGTNKFYNKHFMLIAFVVFFILSFIVEMSNISFEDPVMLLIASVTIFLFLGWTVMTDTKALQILLIALVGSFAGHIVATII